LSTPHSAARGRSAASIAGRLAAVLGSVVIHSQSEAQRSPNAGISPRNLRVAPAPPPAPTGPPTIHLRDGNNPLVAMRLVLRVGSRDDPPGKEGLAALTAAMIAEAGTPQMTHEQVLARFYPMASELSVECRKEVTVFSSLAHRETESRFLPIFVAMLTRPRLTTEDFERLRGDAIDFLTKTLRGGDDEELSKQALQAELYRGHPYGHVDRGTVEGLKSITLDDVLKFHREYYSRDSLLLGFAGAVDRSLLSEYRSYLNTLPAAIHKPPPLPQPTPPRGLDVTIIEKPAPATAIALGFPIDVTRRDDDFCALAVANCVLGDHRTFNGRLMRDLRERRGLNYGDYSYVEDFIQDGATTFASPNNPRGQQYFMIWLRPTPHDKAVFALRAALWELDRLVKHGVEPSEFEATRSYLLNSSKLWTQTLSRRLGYVLDGSLYDRDDLPTELTRRLPSLKLEDVNAAIKRRLARPGIKVVMVSPHAESLAKSIGSGKSTPLVYDTAGTPAEVLREDAVIAGFPLRDATVKVVPVAEVFEHSP
jgi:zinc protease